MSCVRSERPRLLRIPTRGSFQGLSQPGPPSSHTGRLWGIALTAKSCRGQSHVPGGDLKPLTRTTPTVCRHQSLEQGQDIGWSPSDRTPGLEHTQGSASHQERLWREGPVVRTFLLDGPPPRPPTTSGGHGHGQRGPLAHILGSGGCSIPRALQQLPEGVRALQWMDGGLGVEAAGPNPTLPALFTGHPSQRRPWRHGAVGAERPHEEPRSVSASRVVRGT